MNALEPFLCLRAEHAFSLVTPTGLEPVSKP
jgi:hypothetical protein